MGNVDIVTGQNASGSQPTRYYSVFECLMLVRMVRIMNEEVKPRQTANLRDERPSRLVTVQRAEIPFYPFGLGNKSPNVGRHIHTMELSAAVPSQGAEDDER